MELSDFDLDERWCPSCGRYVPYLGSPAEAWCAECGDGVSLLSPEDRELFQDEPRRDRRRASRPGVGA